MDGRAPSVSDVNSVDGREIAWVCYSLLDVDIQGLSTSCFSVKWLPQHSFPTICVAAIQMFFITLK